MKDLEVENSRLEKLCKDQSKELDHLRQLHQSGSEQLLKHESEVKRLQALFDDDIVVKDLKSELMKKDKRLDEMYGWYDYLTAENRRLSEHSQWLEGRVQCLKDIGQRRERCIEEGRSQYQFLVSKHQVLLNHTSQLNAHVEGLQKERDLFDDLRAEYNSLKSMEPHSILKKESARAVPSHYRVRFDDSANTEFIFHRPPTNTDDSFPVTSVSSFFNKAATDLFIDYNSGNTGSAIQSPDSADILTKDSCRDSSNVSGYSSQPEVYAYGDCV